MKRITRIEEYSDDPALEIPRNEGDLRYSITYDGNP